MTLAEHIDQHRGSPQILWDNATDTYSVQGCCFCGWTGPELFDNEANSIKARQDHAAHVAAAWAEHRTVTTEAELAALPDGSVVLSNAEAVRQKDGDDWHGPGSDYYAGHLPVGLPATILHNPKEDQ